MWVLAAPLFREWSELSVRYNLVRHNQCDSCLPTRSPEPANWILGLTGVVIVLSRGFFQVQRKRKIFLLKFLRIG